MIRFLKDWIIPIIIGSLIAFLIQTFFGIANVNGHSMDPNLQNEERLIIAKKATIKRFDIIVFNAKDVDPNDKDNLSYVKRVIGLPGDKLTYLANGDLKINNKIIKQSFISKKAKTTDTLTLVNADYPNGFDLKTISEQQNWTKPMTSNKIPKGYYFVMGDNRKISNDGRYWGLVPKNKIMGVAKYNLALHKIK